MSIHQDVQVKSAGRIGKGAIVGMGAVVLSDVADGEVVVGNPGNVIRKVDD